MLVSPLSVWLWSCSRALSTTRQNRLSLSQTFGQFTLPVADLAMSVELKGNQHSTLSTTVTTLTEIDSFLVCLSKMFSGLRPRGPLRVGPPQANFDLPERGRPRDCLGEIVFLSLKHANLSILAQLLHRYGP